MKLKVLTFNIHHGKGTDGILNMRRILEVLKESKADIIGLNEVDKHFSKRTDYIDQITYLAKHLQMYHAFGATFTLKSKKEQRFRQYGNAFLSLYPIRYQQNHRFNFYTKALEGRALLEIKLHVYNQLLKVFVTHLSLNPLLHKKQTDFIIEQARKEHVPSIILGDWNMKPYSNPWRKVVKYFTDVCVATDNNSLCTFPSFNPKRRLDYIFVSKEFKILSTDVNSKFSVASDHLPLTTTLILE